MNTKQNLAERMRETLFNAFANPDICNAQEHKTFWAIEEGLNRVSDLKYDYRINHARKKHECVRDCEIGVGEKYFRSTNSWSGIKLCANCMAMILYFLKVWDLPTFQYDYWDDENGRPHLDENSNYWKNVSGAVENT